MRSLILRTAALSRHVSGAAILPRSSTRGMAATRRRRNEIAHEKAVATRHVLEFAATFDPLRTARLELSQTLDRLGWEHNSSETVADGVQVDFTMKETYCAFTVVDENNLVPVGHPDASTTPAMPLLRRGRDGNILMPKDTPFPDVPAPWVNPAQGLMLDQTTASRHALIRSKGWELVAIPLQLWRLARASKKQHHARRDVVTSLTLPLAPFQARPVALQAEAQSKAAKDDVRSGSGGGKVVGDAEGHVENNRGRSRSRTRRVAAESTAAGVAAAAAVKAEHRTALTLEREVAAAALVAAKKKGAIQSGTGSAPVSSS